MPHKSLSLLAVFTLLGVCGCGDPARPHLERLVYDWGVVIATGYTHSDDYTRDEQRVHMFHEQSVAMTHMLSAFLADDPPVSDELKQLLRKWKKVNDENAAIHAKMISENRFIYTVEEQSRVDTLVRADFACGGDLMSHLEGY
ncbi:hypothetical protein [Roseimaritima ulvae]|nr:hypothetical protein [Roseimaritima ulvae]